MYPGKYPLKMTMHEIHGQSKNSGEEKNLFPAKNKTLIFHRTTSYFAVFSGIQSKHLLGTLY
jgi:hypothetical protein